MIVLDTNIVSALIGDRSDRAVVTWLDAVPEAVGVTSVTAAELRLGVALLPSGRRRDRLRVDVETMLTEDFEGAVLAFDDAASEAYAEVVAGRRRLGRPVGVLDAQIAAICLSRDATLATRNVRDFSDTGVKMINPWIQ